MIKPAFQDIQRIQKEVQQVFDVAGETVVWRKLVGFAEGKPEYGVGGEKQYSEKPIRLLFFLPNLPHRSQEGGFSLTGETRVYCQEEISNEDELFWNGKVWRVASNPVPVSIGTDLFYSFQVVVANGG